MILETKVVKQMVWNQIRLLLNEGSLYFALLFYYPVDLRTRDNFTS